MNPLAGGLRRAAVRVTGAALAAALVPRFALAFDSKGHVVIEALAYRALLEGHDGAPARPEVLRDLFTDGALAPPLCFGWAASPPGYCRDAGQTKANPLLQWPKPLTDQPDAAFRRQFSDAGQCFHFMAKLEDAQTELVAGTDVPRATGTSALTRCRDLLDNLLRQIVIDGGPGTRRSGYGLYELMHSIGDSFSGAHTQRRPGGHEIEELRVWKPLTRLPGFPSKKLAGIPKSAFHNWDDQRDKAYAVQDKVTAQGRCKDLVNFPYEVPFECLAQNGELARQSIVDLLIVVHDLRMARLAAPASTADPEKDAAWAAYKAKWFAPALSCSGAECAERQPVDALPGAYGLIGLDTRYNWSRDFFDVAAKGMLLRYSWDLNPFLYALAGQLGYRHYKDGGGAGLAGLELGLILPLGRRAALGFVPAAWKTTFGGEKSGSELSTRFFRFDYNLSNRVALTLDGPLEINWRRPAAEWSVGVGISYTLRSVKLAGGSLIEHHEEKVDRRDDSWSPPAAPYGRLLGRAASLYVATGATTVETPAAAVENRQYGGGSIGGQILWDRDRWGGRFEWAPGGSLSIGARNTSGESAYFTGIFALNARWYLVRVLGLSFTPVRLEGGPKIRGKEELDTSPDVHGDAGSQYYFQAGTRLGLAFNAGIVDILVEAPTIAWRSQPFKGGEILSIHLGFRLN